MKDVILTRCMTNYFYFNNIPHSYKVHIWEKKKPIGILFLFHWMNFLYPIQDVST